MGSKVRTERDWVDDVSEDLAELALLDRDSFLAIVQEFGARLAAARVAAVVGDKESPTT